MSSDRPSAFRICCYTAAALVALPLSYYAAQEGLRHRTMRKRRKRFQRKMAEIDARLARDGSVIEGEQLEAVSELYGSLSVLGRYQNPFREWREEGAWEWFVWQFLWKPLKGRVAWDGGVSDSAERAKILPSERPDFKLLFGVDPEAKDKGRIDDLTHFDSLLPQPVRNIEEVDTEHLSVKKPPASPDSWESLAGSREISVTSQFTCTWFGQSTCFITLDGVSILTDPVFADRLLEWAGPRRQRPPPAPLAHLLRVDIVLVSHDHFDHLGIDVVDYLGDTAQWIVPLGLGWLFRSRGITRVIELDWWSQTRVRDLNITFCPSMHWSARSPTTTNQSLWGSFVVQGKEDSFFHCGDTGHVPELSEQIGKLFGPISLALLPIGAYQPRWHLAPQHIDPDSAVKIHKQLRAKRSIGYHWGTWSLSDDRYDDPLRDLAIARQRQAVSEEAFTTVHLGYTLVLST